MAVCASVPLALDEPVISDNDRYRDMAETFGQVARRGTTCGMHVHVAIDSPEEGVCCIDRITPWLPILLAVSTNSPYEEGRDTGYASWRTQLWSDVAQRRSDRAVRLARRLPPRLRAHDGQRRGAGSRDALLRRAPVRGAPHARGQGPRRSDRPRGRRAAHRAGPGLGGDRGRAAGPRRLPVWRAEELRAARWRASRYGLADRLLDPVTHALRPAREVLSSLVDLVADRLEAAGDSERVARGVERVLGGTGASRQRAAYERTGSIEGVVDDVAGPDCQRHGPPRQAS